MAYKKNPGQHKGRRSSDYRSRGKTKKTAESKTRVEYEGLKIWTDGSALKNPYGAMGWAWYDENGRHDCGGASNGTNQIGELTALYQALLAHPVGDLHIISDSQYTINVASKWIRGWKRNGWKTAAGYPVKNLPIIQAIDKILSSRNGKVVYEWVKGHAGNEGNETVDRLAHGYAMKREAGVGEDKMPVIGMKTLEYNESQRLQEEADKANGIERVEKYHGGLKLKPGQTKKPWNPRKTSYTNHR